MIKQILVVGLLFMVLSGVGNAATDIKTGNISVTGGCCSGGGSGYWTSDSTTLQNDLSIAGNYTYYTSYSFTRDGWGYTSTNVVIKGTQLPRSPGGCNGNDDCGSDTYTTCFTSSGNTAGTWSGSGSMTDTCDASTYACMSSYVMSTWCGGGYSPAVGSIKGYIIYTSDPIYHISGTTDCVNNVSLYYNNSDTWIFMGENYLDDDYYSFNVTTGIDFKLIFDDDHSYEFNVTGNTVYNYDGCLKTQYRFEESCGNLIPDSEGYFLEWNPLGWWNMETWFEESDGILSITNSSATKISIYTNTFIGSTGWLIDPVASDNTYTLENPNIAWGLKVIVQNESDGALIDGAMVKVDQDCYCASGYSTRQKLTVNGMSQFGDMSLQDASLFVMKTGYKILDENSTGYSAFLSGRSNFSSKTWIVKLANTSSNNSSTFYEVPNKVDIHFRDINGNITSKILDTDAYVDLYYQNNNTEEEAMTLKFESSSTHTYFMPEQTYTIPHDTSGYKRITNEYFTPYDYSYRAVIYNSSIYGWNITIPLTVRNATKEEEQHYQNLTTNLWFMYASDGKIDSREDMRIVSHARSNNTTLMNIDIEVYKNDTLLCYKNLTASDYAGASYPYYYLYEPSYSYVSGANYTIKMYGFDRTLLEIRYVKCITDSVTRKNKLTIIVKDNYGHNLNNAFVYLEGYGSLSTGVNSYYNSYEGLSNKYYRYKATKTNYEGSGWSDVTISDNDEIVTYVLTATGDTNTTSMNPIKMNDDEMKNLYYCLMMFLLIFILFGGLMYLAK